jgi:hypothetical protein
MGQRLGQHPGAELMRRPCIGCGRLIERGSYCSRCYPRGTSWTQEKFRRATLALTGGRCARCGSTDRVQAHHDPAVENGGGSAQVGTPLCWRCHRLAETRCKSGAPL